MCSQCIICNVHVFINMYLWTYFIAILFYRVSAKVLSALISHYKTHGLVPREMKSGGRKSNRKALSHEDTDRVYRFIRHYAEDHAVCLPGRVQGFKRDDIFLLPSARPKSAIHRLYKQTCEETGGYLLLI